MKPPRSILDPAFVYVPAKAHEGSADYLRAKLRRIRDEIQAEQRAATARVVRPMRGAKVSDTPRTDGAIERGECGPDFARTLERELAEAREREMMKAQQCSAERLRANAAEKELAALRARLASAEAAPRADCVIVPREPTEEIIAATHDNDDDLPGMLAVAKGVAEQKFPHTVDAQVWAAEFNKTFAQLHEGCELDEGWLIGWFANAIMAGYDTATLRSERQQADAAEKELAALRKWTPPTTDPSAG